MKHLFILMLLVSSLQAQTKLFLSGNISGTYSADTICVDNALGSNVTLCTEVAIVNNSSFLLLEIDDCAPSVFFGDACSADTLAINLLEQAIVIVDELEDLSDLYSAGCTVDPNVMKLKADEYLAHMIFAEEVVDSLATYFPIASAKPLLDARFDLGQNRAIRFKELVDEIPCQGNTPRLYGALFFMVESAAYIRDYLLGIKFLTCP